MRLLALCVAMAAAVGCGSSDEHACSIALDRGIWEEYESGNLEHVEPGLIPRSELDGPVDPESRATCWAHSEVTPRWTGNYLVWTKGLERDDSGKTYETRAQLIPVE